MKQMDEIKMSKAQQKDVMDTFWFMMRELESAADQEKGKALEKHAVEGFYRQWNSIMDDNKEPQWIIRARKAENIISHELNREAY